MNNLDSMNATHNKKEDQTINPLDILKYLFFHWKWFLVSVIVAVSFFQYQYSATPFVYMASETVMVRTPMNTPITANITNTNNAFNSVSVTGEVLQLRSKELMRQTIRHLDADISYTVRKGLRDHELYKKTPVQVKVLNSSADAGYSFMLTPLDSQTVMIKSWSEESGDESIKVPLNKEVSTPLGKIILTPSSYYSPASYGKEIQITKYPQNRMVGVFVGKLNITQVKEDASILQVSLSDDSPERAADVITTLISVYNENSIADKNQIAINTANFIRDRLDIIESELGSVETDIERLKTSNQGVDVNVAGGMYLSDSRQFQSERGKIETDQKLVEMMREYLTNKNKQKELIPNNTGLVDANVERLIEDYNSTLLKKNRLEEGGSVANPLVQELDNALQSMRRNIEMAVDNAYAGLAIRIKNIQKEENQARNQVLQIPQKQRVMLSVGRQQKVKEELYIYLLNKREENAINQAKTDDNIRIVDPAFGSSAPIYPIHLKKLLMGAGIGFALPAVILILIMMFFDNHVRGKKDIDDALTIPFLGEIPQVVKGKDGGELVIDQKSRDYTSEMFRIVRTNIGFMAAGKEARIITFTSFHVGAGKTFSAINLAVSFNYLKKKVLLLDLDLRKGTLSERVNAPKGLGITNYLADSKVTLEDVIYRNHVLDAIDIIPIGIVAPNPVELLLSTRLDEIMVQLKTQYDYIIIDNVPVNLVADASIVNRISELTIFVIRSGKMDRRQLPEVQDLYDQKKLNNLAILLNGVNVERRKYGYGYGYGHDYGYGYGNEKKEGVLSKFISRRS